MSCMLLEQTERDNLKLVGEVARLEKSCAYLAKSLDDEIKKVKMLEGIVKKQAAKLERWEDEDVHESMECYISHKKMDEANAKIKKLEKIVEDSND